MQSSMHLSILASLCFSFLAHSATVLGQSCNSSAQYGNYTIMPYRNVSNGHWVDTWTAMPQLTEYTNLPLPPFVGTVRSMASTTDLEGRTVPMSHSSTRPSARRFTSQLAPPRFACASPMHLVSAHCPLPLSTLPSLSMAPQERVRFSLRPYSS